MGYALNFNLIWRHFDKAVGRPAAQPRARRSSRLPSASSSGWCLRSGMSPRAGGARHHRRLCRIHSQRALILLVYLVFYGLPTVADLAYSAQTSFIATLSLYSGAYLVEVFRSGLEAVPRGQLDAGKAIGLTPWQRLRHVRLPTMLRITLPALSNTFISLFKDTSIASVISVPELTYGAQWINFNTFRIVEVYLVTTAMYLFTGYIMLFGLRLLERRYRAAR